MATVKTILLHEHPDLDAVFASWLVARFGGNQFPGAARASYQFAPVGELPDARSAAQLELAGILPIDTGFGRFDNHGKAEPTSSATLVARALALELDAALKPLLAFVHQHDVSGIGIRSRQAGDQLMSVPTLLRGLNVLWPREPLRVVQHMHVVFDALYATEREWQRALDDSKGARWVVLANGGRLIAIQSESSAAMKVGRYRGAAVVVHRDRRFANVSLSRGSVCDTGTRLAPAAALLRAAEALERGADKAGAAAALSEAGEHFGWFLHESGNILSNGSPKRAIVQPTKIPWAVLPDLVACALDTVRALPDRYCDGRCVGSCRLGEEYSNRCLRAAAKPTAEST